MPQSATREQTPEEFARSLGASITTAETKPAAGADDPGAFAQQLGGKVEPFQTYAGPVPPMADHPEAIIASDRPWDQLWRGLYAAIPDLTGAVGAGIGTVTGFGVGAGAGAVAVPGVGAVPGGPLGGLLGGEIGAGVGGGIGRGIQAGIDYFGGRPEALTNPRSVAGEMTRQMEFETVGRAMGGVLDRFRGYVTPRTALEAERLKTNRDYDLKLSIGEITDRPGIRRTEYFGQRGVGGYARQKYAQARTDKAAATAVSQILDTVGPTGTATGAGVEAQDAIRAAAARGGRRLEGAVSTNLAPATGTGQAGTFAAEGVQAGRNSFARQQAAYGKLINEAPPVDMTALHNEAWRVFNEDIMPKLIENPALGPKTAEWQKVVRLYRKLSERSGGQQYQPSPELVKALGEAALEKAPYGPLRVINQVLATPQQMSFSGALTLRSALRDAGKGQELLAGDAAQALATYFETGSRVSDFKGIRGLLAETHAPYEAAAEAYRTNRDLFESAFVQKVAETNPEAVLQALTSAEGRLNASRIRDMGRVLQDLPRTHGTPAEVAAGKKAWDTLRAEWFRRDVMQDNVFGLSDRMAKVDPDVLRAWFPDLAGKNVLQQARVTAGAFQSQLLASLAEADPAKIVDMIGASPARVREFETSLAKLPGPVNRAPLLDRVRRAWTEANLTSGDPNKLADRIAKTDPELLKTWFATPDQQTALQNLTRIGNALATRRPVVGMGAYESLGAVTIVGSLLRGNLGQALTTAIGFEGIPAFLSWAMYSPRVQQYLMEAASPTAMTLSKTTAVIRTLDAYRQATQQPAPMQTPAQQPAP